MFACDSGLTEPKACPDMSMMHGKFHTTCEWACSQHGRMYHAVFVMLGVRRCLGG